MEHYLLRLKSFEGIEKNFKINVNKLAEAGFYFSGIVDEVVCFVCNVRIFAWEEDDDPEVEHKAHSPSCPFHSCCKESLQVCIFMTDFKNKLDKIYYLQKKVLENNPANCFDIIAKEVLTNTFNEIMQTLEGKNYVLMKHNHLIDLCELSDCSKHNLQHNLPCSCHMIKVKVDLIIQQTIIYYHYLMRQRGDYYTI
uniref:Baculoviral IAP repeat-containing protein 3 n=1 Tax=Cacopsylla melanoneura TaxID=428564 RepID=A0A8D8ZSC5_9HEMI